MRARTAAALWAVAVVLVVGAAAFDVVNRAAGAGDPWLPSIAAAALGFGTLGGLIARRHPGNPIGWLILAVGVGHAVSGIALGYGAWAARRPVPGSGAALALWVGNWAWSALVVMPAVFLLFPSGRLPTSRLRPVLGVALAVAPLYAVGIAIAPVQLYDVPPVGNPFGVAAAGPFLEAAATS